MFRNDVIANCEGFGRAGRAARDCRIARRTDPRAAARNARSDLTRRLEKLAEPAALPAIVLAAALMLTVGASAALRPVDRGGDPAIPAAALAAARALNASGPVFNTHRYGGYLISEGVPVFIDGRLEMYGDTFFARYLAASGGDEKVLTELLDYYALRGPYCCRMTARWQCSIASPAGIAHMRMRRPSSIFGTTRRVTEISAGERSSPQQNFLQSAVDLNDLVR